MTQDEIADIKRSEEAAKDARREREALRRKTEPADPGRNDRIERRLDLVREAMDPLRRLIGQFIWRDDITAAQEARIRAASQALQYERKQLKKMRRR